MPLANTPVVGADVSKNPWAPSTPTEQPSSVTAAPPAPPEVFLAGVVPTDTKPPPYRETADALNDCFNDCCPADCRQDPQAYFDALSDEDKKRYIFITGGFTLLCLLIIIVIAVSAGGSSGDSSGSSGSSSTIQFGLTGAIQLSGLAPSQFIGATADAFKSMIGTRMGVASTSVNILSV